MSDLTGKRFRHIKRGTEYEVIGVGRMQSKDWGDLAKGQMVDMREVVTYRSLADGSLWTRPLDEFDDGRFEAIDSITPPDAGCAACQFMEELFGPNWETDTGSRAHKVRDKIAAALVATQERLGECNAGYETLVKELAAEKARVDEEGQRLLRAYEELADCEDRCDTLAGALRTTKEACEIIAGKRQCLDNLMGNRDVAEAALVAIDAALATIPAKPETKPMDDMTEAARDVLAERRRQIEEEGWTPEHDDKHGDGALATAAACYIRPDLREAKIDDAGVRLNDPWPWWNKLDLGRGFSIAKAWWKPKDRRRDLVKAGALILAEIERLDRIPAKPSTITFDADKVWDKGDRFDGPDPVALAPIPAKPETEP